MSNPVVFHCPICGHSEETIIAGNILEVEHCGTRVTIDLSRLLYKLLNPNCISSDPTVKRFSLTEVE